MKRARVKIRKFFELPDGISRGVDVNKEPAVSDISDNTTNIDSEKSDTSEHTADGKEK